MTHPVFPQLAIIASSLILAVTEVVNELTETAGKIGTMGMQGLLALMLLVLGWVIWHLEKKRTADRDARDKLLTGQYDNLLKHHETFAQEVNAERNGFHLEMKAHAAELRGLTERSIVAMLAMATSTDALREYLKDRRATLGREERVLRDG